MNSTELLKELYEIVKEAIDSGDWKVDGACDPDSTLSNIEYYLEERGYRKDGITGTTWIKDTLY